MEISFFKIILIVFVVLVLFGAGKLPQVMGDFGKGIRALKEAMKGDEAKKPEDTRQISDTNKDKNA